MNIGQKIMEGIIDSNLLHAKCAHDDEHGCVTVWSSGAAEQIEAMCQAGRQLASSTGYAALNVNNTMNALLEQLRQLTTVTWDGNLISKEHRDRLVKSGLVQRYDGYNWLTQKGVEYSVNLGILAA